MNSFRPMVAIALICAGFSLLRAEDAASPVSLAKQYSADMVITTKDGTTITNKSYFDDGKMRTEMNARGMQMVSIVRPDLKRVYQVLVAQKMIMEMPYDPEKFKKEIATASGPQGKFEVIGPDTLDGVACMKYKVISAKDGKVLFDWVDTARKIPVKIAAEDGSFTLVWKNYKAGPQDASLFEPPSTGYQVMTMPTTPPPVSAPGAGQ